MTKAKVKDEVAALLSEVEIGPYKIKPWSFGRFKKVYPNIIRVLPDLKGILPILERLTPKNAVEVLSENGVQIMESILPAITPLISGTLDIPEEEVDEMDFEQATAIGFTIICQNLGRIKNSLPLIVGQMKAAIRAT